MKSIFKEGDKVYHIQYGWGEVVGKVDTNLGSLVKARFNFGDKHITFIMDGKLKNLLSFTEYTLEGFSEQRPEPLPKKGDVVWGKGSYDNDWNVGHYLGMSEYYYKISSKPNGAIYWLADKITTTNPYANGK